MNNARANVMVALCCAGATTAVAWASAQGQAQPPNVASAGRCRVDGRVTSGAAPLPGVALQVHSGSALRAATSTDLDGRYTILFAPNAGYMLAAELPAFTRVEREVTLGAPTRRTPSPGARTSARSPASTIRRPRRPIRSTGACRTCSFPATRASAARRPLFVPTTG